MLVEQHGQTRLLGKFQHRDQPRTGHQIFVIEHGGRPPPGMGQFHRKCPSDPQRFGLQQTDCRRSKGTFFISAPTTKPAHLRIQAKGL